MSDEAVNQTQAGTSKGPQPGRGSNRPARGGHRGGRGRGRRGPGRPRPPQSAASEQQPESAGEPALEESRQETPAPSPAQVSPREHQPASPQTIQNAIEEVTRIIETLKETQDDMEEVLETLELAERQKDADEREIESLRRGFRQMQRPRESGSYGPPSSEATRGARREQDTAER